MVRTTISISRQDKRWLDRVSRLRHRSAAETVRLAIREYRRRADENSYGRTLKETAGTWQRPRPDSQQLVQGWRGEWEKRG